MKKLSTILMLMLALSAEAQTLETQADFPTGYIATSYFTASNTIKSIDGVLYMIYDDIPIALVRYPAMNPREEFEVPSSVRRICNNAFQGTKYLKTLRIHNEVSDGRNLHLLIGESAFNDSSIENFEVIENHEQAATHSKPATAAPREETARYNVAGCKVSDQTKGLQIVSYSDHTAQKVVGR